MNILSFCRKLIFRLPGIKVRVLLMEERSGSIIKKSMETLGMIKYIDHDVTIVSWAYKYSKIHQIVHFKCMQL